MKAGLTVLLAVASASVNTHVKVETVNFDEDLNTEKNIADTSAWNETDNILNPANDLEAKKASAWSPGSPPEMKYSPRWSRLAEWEEEVSAEAKATLAAPAAEAKAAKVEALKAKAAYEAEKAYKVYVEKAAAAAEKEAAYSMALWKAALARASAMRSGEEVDEYRSAMVKAAMMAMEYEAKKAAAK